VSTLPDRWEYPLCNLCGHNEQDILLANAKGTGMDLVECRRCGLRYFSPRPSWELVRSQICHAQETADRSFQTGSLMPNEQRPREQVLVDYRSYYSLMIQDALSTFGRTPTTMFEVGGGVGWFSVFAREAGIPGITGLDLDECAVKIAHDELCLDFTAGDFLEYEPRLKHDMVVALDYLEHTYHPRQDMDKLTAMLNPGGVMLLKTFLDEFDYAREMLAPPTHAIHWTTHTLRREIIERGLEIKQWRLDYGGYFVIIIAQKPTT
jgi:2-polyprenyl-3-methyl-5-hydroxy-6-metoxy-1,4-benzoquinol methylase